MGWTRPTEFDQELGISESGSAQQRYSNIKVEFFAFESFLQQE